MAGAVAKTEWHFGQQHDEVLDATLKARERAKRLLEAQLAGKSKVTDDKGNDKNKAKVPVSDLIRIVREHISSHYDDIFDAFTELDMNGNGRLSKIEFREGIKAMGGEPGKFTPGQMDDVFEYMDSKSEGQLCLENFITVFSTDKKKKKKEDGKDEDKGGRGLQKRSFTEVIMECKDNQGVEQNIPVPVKIQWDALLQKLKQAYNRAVTLMYEDSGGHQITVKDAKDWVRCLDSLEISGKGEEGTKHLECMIIEFDTNIASKSRAAAVAGASRPSLSERKHNAARVRGNKGADDPERDPVESLDFRSRHKWIDDMMRVLGAPLENEPGAMSGKWDNLVKSCKQLDISSTGTMTVEAFRNALMRTEPRMTAHQVDWYVQDSDKDHEGNVLYEYYAETKKRGQAAGQMLRGQEDKHRREVEQAAEKIMAALKANFKSLSHAFKRMDEDRDGRLSREEFRKGVEQRLKLRLPTRLIDELIRNVDSGGDGFIDYEDFLRTFNAFDRRKEEKGRDDALSDEELARMVLSAKLNIAELFRYVLLALRVQNYKYERLVARAHGAVGEPQHRRAFQALNLLALLAQK